MHVMGIDPSTRTGIAIVERTNWEGPPTIPEVRESAEIHFPKLIGFERLSAIAGEVMALYEKWKPKFVVIEGYALYNVTSIIPVVEVGTVIRYFLWQEGASVYECNPSTLKKFVCGTGKAKKDQMMLGVFKRWGYEGTDNQCDAVGLAMYGLAHPNGPPQPVKKPNKKKGLVT